MASVTQFVYMQTPNKLDAFEDFKTYPQRVRETHRNELSLFFKDDWKVRPSLTLNLGLRWDWFGSIYDGYGMMPLPTKGPEAIFGLSGRSWDDWFSSSRGRRRR
jgi:outer membrane receptor protein involved in Fe transport